MHIEAKRGIASKVCKGSKARKASKGGKADIEIKETKEVREVQDVKEARVDKGCCNGGKESKGSKVYRRM